MTPASSLRCRLRDATSDAHAQLDARVGTAFDDAAGYAAFLRGMHGFIQAAACAIGDGRLDAARTALAADLAHLHTEPAQRPLAPDVNSGESLGWRYVAAGASLGARVLQGRARRLGMTPDAGARYLAVQATGSDWPAVLADLATAPDAAHAPAISGARAAFDCAQRCMDAAFA